MRPEARVAAAIEVLNEVLAGHAAEATLTRWGRANRYAGSGDRAAIRDHVYDALRCKRSFAVLGGALTGRGLMLGWVRAAGADPESTFTGDRHAPEPLTADERAALSEMPHMSEAQTLDVPDWIFRDLQAAFGGKTKAVLGQMKSRAPAHLRTNTLKGTRAKAMAALAADGIEGQPHPLSETAIEVVGRTRKIRHSKAFTSGLVEFQDAAVQAACDRCAPMVAGARVLDFCAGGGGKALALAAFGPSQIVAHDGIPARMADLPTRAERAGAPIAIKPTEQMGQADPFDLVVVDVPCSGSGTWRRDPEAKWALTRARLDDLLTLQSEILDAAQAHVAEGGTLTYMTCSLLPAENTKQIDAFLGRNPAWNCGFQHMFTPLDGGDGFFVAHLTR